MTLLPNGNSKKMRALPIFEKSDKASELYSNQLETLMENIVLKRAIRNMVLCLSSSGALFACGGATDSSSGNSKMLADGEACQAAWAAATAYNGGAMVSRNGRNYTAAYWTQGNDPAVAGNSGP